ncbi:13421_t:CDS:1, partial [Dentiscutata erythropus]
NFVVASGVLSLISTLLRVHFGDFASGTLSVFLSISSMTPWCLVADFDVVSGAFWVSCCRFHFGYPVSFLG